MAKLFYDDIQRLRDAVKEIYSAMEGIERLKEDLEEWDRQADTDLNEDAIEEMGEVYEDLLDITTRLEELM